MSDEAKLAHGVEVPCCACDGLVRFMVADDGDTLIGHSTPVCARYAATNDEDQAADYARDCRLALGGKGGG